MPREPLSSDTVLRARAFAVAAHGEQLYGDQPYVIHLDAVAELLKPYGENAQIVGFLHDVAEDTSVTLESVRQDFGDHVAECVALVTDESGENRKERKAKTNAKLSRVGSALHLALIVKAADRLANLRASAAESTGSKLGKYCREHPAFKEAAYRVGLCNDLWSEMDQILSRRSGGA
jgi:(p)ppGpp synthase/HD superfamily hydrolase